MGSGFRLLWDTFKVFLLFTGCTLLFYYGMVWLNQEYENYHRYDEPEGKAVKVAATSDQYDTGWFNRLLYFYNNGE